LLQDSQRVVPEPTGEPPLEWPEAVERTNPTKVNEKNWSIYTVFALCPLLISLFALTHSTLNYTEFEWTTPLTITIWFGVLLPFGIFIPVAYAGGQMLQEPFLILTLVFVGVFNMPLLALLLQSFLMLEQPERSGILALILFTLPIALYLPILLFVPNAAEPMGVVIGVHYVLVLALFLCTRQTFLKPLPMAEPVPAPPQFVESMAADGRNSQMWKWR